MMQILLIGLGAGAASALLFVSVVSGALTSLLLIIFAQLPILIAAIGWTHLAGLAGMLVASAGLTLVFNGSVGFLFLITVGLPAWWIGYLVLLARPVASAEPGAMEWYPVGRIVAWTAIAASTIVFVSLLRFGADIASVRTGLRREIELASRLFAALQVRGFSDPERTKDALALIIPGMKAVGFTMVSLANVWLAALVVKISGRLRRPWPAIAQMSLPPFTPIVLVAAVAATFLPELIGLAGSVFTASLLLAYALLGLAVVHVVTRGIAGRAVMLTCLYIFVMLLSWPLLLVMSMLGMLETMLALRARVAARRPPPPPGSIDRP